MLTMFSSVRSYLPFVSARVVESAGTHPYRLVDLGTDDAGNPLLPAAFNDHGTICVASHDAQRPGVMRALFWQGSCGETAAPLPVAFGQSPVASLSSQGHVVGTTGQDLRALRAWASHLGVFGERCWPEAISFAVSVNSAGTVVGNVLFDSGEFFLSRAFIVSPSGAPRFIMPPHGGTTNAVAINAAGHVAFNAAALGAPRDETRAWCLIDGCYVSISSLGGGRSAAHALTPQGRVVGWSLTNTGATHAFLWENGRMLDLGTLDGGRAEALAANDARVVVGRTLAADGTRQAFRWTEDDGMQPLENLADLPRGWTLREATAIDASGTILGIGGRRGEARGFLLKPRSNDSAA